MRHKKVPPVEDAKAGTQDSQRMDQAAVELPASTASDSDSGPANAGPAKETFKAASAVLTQAAVQGIRFDFNDGCRVTLPRGKWKVRLSDFETGNTLFETEIGAGSVASSKKYFVPLAIEIDAGGERVFEHRFCAKDQPVLIQFPVGTLGDIIAWFPYAVKFQRLHGCKLTCAMSALLIPLFQAVYPEIEFLAGATLGAQWKW